MIARTVAIIPTDVLDSDSGWAAAGELVSLKIHNGNSLTAGQFVLPMSSINFDMGSYGMYFMRSTSNCIHSPMNTT